MILLPFWSLRTLSVPDPAVRKPATTDIHQICIDTGRWIKPCTHILYLRNRKRSNRARDRPFEILHILRPLPLLSSNVERMLWRTVQSVVISLHEDCWRAPVADCNDLFPVIAMRQASITDFYILDGLITGICKNQRTSSKARASESQHIHRRNLIAVNLRDIPQMLHLWKAAGGHGDGVGFYFAGEHRRNAILRSGQFKGAATREQRPQRHHAGTSRSSNTTGIFAWASFYRSFISSRISGYTPLSRRRERICLHSRTFAFITMCVAVELGRIFRASSGFSPFCSRK